MASSVPVTGNTSRLSPNVVIADGEPLDLYNRTLAAFLAWLIPGAGHYYQRRYFKATIFSVAILGTFLLGMIVGGGRCVFLDRKTDLISLMLRMRRPAKVIGLETRWQFALQAGIGLPALPAVYQNHLANSNKPLLFNGFMAPPKDENEWREWNERSASGIEMGTLYTMIAGLLNILAIFDAYGGPLPPPTHQSKKSSEAKKDEEPSST